MNDKWRKLLLGAVVTAAAIYYVASHFDKIQTNILQRDSLYYWQAGKQLVHRENVYEVKRIRTPPWSLFLFLPLGLVNALWGWILWMTASVASLVVTLRLAWKTSGARKESRSIFLVVGYLFAPVLACLESGQIGFILLLGIALFLAYYDQHPYLAGAALILPFAKPHLLLFFWTAFALWVLVRRKFKVATGFAGAVCAATLLALVLDPSVFHHYRELSRQSAIEGEFIPTVSTVLRIFVARQWFALQFVPTFLGAIWCLWYCGRNLNQWSWQNHGFTVMVVSILTTPYSFLNDEVVLLPAMLFAALCIFRDTSTLTLGAKIAVLALGLLNWMMLLLLALQVPLQSGIYFWSSLLWCAWYFFGRYRLAAGNAKERAPAAALS